MTPDPEADIYPWLAALSAWIAFSLGLWAIIGVVVLAVIAVLSETPDLWIGLSLAESVEPGQVLVEAVALDNQLSTEFGR